ncbi:hypothetical protein EBI_27233 [Enterocytozoon bieneusi H348]|nr:hypothetical protein EBI_27233 [Enterocytozoon bieneusi H348]|eukprot:XP_002651185.1 hypothetical protein EBI_27233 [Enterocytozoon bieneusi H348]
MYKTLKRKKPLCPPILHFPPFSPNIPLHFSSQFSGKFLSIASRKNT